MPEQAAIVLDGVGFSYDAGRWVLRNCTASFRERSIIALLGPNGRGKTTLLKLIIGALKPRVGTVRVQGDIAFVPQAFDTAFGFSALEMVVMGRARKIGLLSQPSRGDVERAYEALDRFGLADLAQRPFHEMSGGQRQLVLLARALVAEAPVVVLDEPTSALDLRNQRIVLEWLTRLSREDGLTVIFSTHQAGHALSVADDALLMLSEDDYAFGPASDVLTEDSLSSLYETPVKRVRIEHNGSQFHAIVPLFAPSENKGPSS
jgi:iron complex transport system ATP-binding protein